MKKILYGLILLILAGTIISVIATQQFAFFSELFRPYSEGPSDLDAGATLLDVPFVQQKTLYCSEASASMILQYYGFDIRQDYIHDNIADRFETMIPPLAEYIPCNYESLNLEDLRREIDENDPVMVRLQIGSYRHTIVIVGYDEGSFFVHDPAEGSYLRIDPEKLLKYWKLTGYLAIIVTS